MPFSGACIARESYEPIHDSLKLSTDSVANDLTPNFVSEKFLGVNNTLQIVSVTELGFLFGLGDFELPVGTSLSVTIVVGGHGELEDEILDFIGNVDRTSVVTAVVLDGFELAELSVAKVYVRFVQVLTDVLLRILHRDLKFND